MLLSVLLVLLKSTFCVSADTSDIRDELYPSYTEYDSLILDPLHAYGSPYGGFSRATSRRLAALPLHLPEIMSMGDDDETNAKDSSSSSSSSSSWDPLYTMVREGTTGQLFACRVYNEDELMPESLNDSMFDPPVLRLNSQSKTAGKEKTESSSFVPEKVKAATTETVEEKKQEITKATDKPPRKKPPPNQAQQAFTLIRMTEKLNVLRGVCAQIHKGWWSYEWCYESTLSQFHVAIVKDAGIEIQDITSLGKFRRRDWTIDTRKEPENELAGDLEEIARIYDQHEGGTICQDTRNPRRSLVRIVCCTEEIMAEKQALLKRGGTSVDKNNDLAFYDIVEDPEKICHYNVTICTPLLCEKPSAASTQDTAKATSTSKQEEEEETQDRSRHKENESIMEILDRTLGGRKPVCLQSITGGWWTFEFCHGKSIRQFHEVVGTRRDKSGVTQTTRTVETDHNLGRPQTSVFQAIVPEDEWKFVVNATDKNGAKRPYFELEYTNGDVCDDHDVRDAAIVAGNSGTKGLSRASSVRFGCGESYDLTVNEDSTCHYVLTVVVPDLCRHPLFKSPVSKKQVFKCLPIDEPDVDANTFLS